MHLRYVSTQTSEKYFVLKKLTIFLIGCVIGSTTFSQSPTGLSIQDKQMRLNALLEELKLPTIETTDATKLISIIPAYRRWALQGAPSKNDTSGSDSAGTPLSLYPGFIERYARASPTKIEIIQQPRTILEQTGTVSLPAGNPDTLLVRYSSTTTWADVFPSVADIHDQAKAFIDSGLTIPATAFICGKELNQVESAKRATQLANCIMRDGKPYRTGRFFEGFKTQFSFGQNPQIEQGISVVGTAAATSNYSVSGEVDFDPKTLFLNGTDWENSYEAVKAYDPDGKLQLMEEFQRRIRHACGPSSDGKIDDRLSLCAKRLSGLTPRQMLGAVLIPQFSEVIKNQFDFVKQGDLLIAAPYPTKNLSDLTFTIDLSRLIPSSKQRQDALKMLTDLKKDTAAKAKTDKLKQDAVIVAKGVADERSDVVTLFADFASEPEKLAVNDDWYETFRSALLRVLTDSQ